MTDQERAEKFLERLRSGPSTTRPDEFVEALTGKPDPQRESQPSQLSRIRKINGTRSLDKEAGRIRGPQAENTEPYGDN
jgi:hypothetical protein